MRSRREHGIAAHTEGQAFFCGKNVHPVRCEHVVQGLRGSIRGNELQKGLRRVGP